MKAPICPYCGNESEITNGSKIYPFCDDLIGLRFWVCWPCDAYVGCHKANNKLGFTGIEPLGTLANAELRKLRSEVHKIFDPLWKNRVFRSRKRAYNWLANVLKIPTDECHIGMFGINRCINAIELIKKAHYEN